MADDGALKDAMADMMSAMKAGDAGKAALAFRRAKEACDESYEEDEEETPVSKGYPLEEK